MSIDTQGAAQLTREQVQSILIQPLQAQSVFLSIPGLRFFDTNGSQVRIPKLSGADDATFVAEGAQIPTREATFDEVVLLPSTMKGVKTLTPYTNELARQSVVALDAAIRDAMVRQVATALDKAFIAGNTANEPTGIIYTDGASIADAATGTPTLDDLMAAEAKAMEANVDTTSLRWLMSPRDWATFRKEKDLQNRYQLQPDPTAPGQFRLLGYPVTVSAHMPSNLGDDEDESTIVLADFSQYGVARDLAPQVTILSELLGDYDKGAIRVVARYDAAALNPAAVVLLQGVTA